MEANISVPKYELRGFSLWGFRDMAQCMDFLFDGGRVKQGTLVAMNAEKSSMRKPIRRCMPCWMRLSTNMPMASAWCAQSAASILARRCLAWPGPICGSHDAARRAGRHPGVSGGGKPSVLAETEQKLRSQWNVNLVGSQDGYFKPEQRDALFERIRASGAAIVTVAMGSPKQEILMRDCRKVHPQALYMGVGGTYDVFTGHVKRAPKVWQNLGLEWLYRLLSQPSRIRRQLRLLKFVGYYYTGKM